MAEEGDLKSLQSGFESQWGHDGVAARRRPTASPDWGETQTRAHAGRGSARRVAPGREPVGRVRVPVGARRGRRVGGSFLHLNPLFTVRKPPTDGGEERKNAPAAEKRP